MVWHENKTRAETSRAPSQSGADEQGTDEVGRSTLVHPEAAGRSDPPLHQQGSAIGGKREADEFSSFPSSLALEFDWRLVLPPVPVLGLRTPLLGVKELNVPLFDRAPVPTS